MTKTLIGTPDPEPTPRSSPTFTWNPPATVASAFSWFTWRIWPTDDDRGGHETPWTL